MDCCHFTGIVSFRYSVPIPLSSQGISSTSYSVRSLQKAFFVGHNKISNFSHRRSLRSDFKSNRGKVFASTARESWDIDGPPNPLKLVESLSGKVLNPEPSGILKKMTDSGIVLVTGATGGVGRRVVDILRNKGVPVRIMVRNGEKARDMFGPDIELSIGDITKAETLNPGHFKGVKKVINAVSVIVGPKEGDTPDRQKYSQGVEFFEPEIKGDPPDKVEYLGMQNLINAVKTSLGLRDGKLLFGFKGNLSVNVIWGTRNDVIIGGVSESSFQIDPTGSETGGPTGLFKGVVSVANKGGFTSIMTENLSIPEDLPAYDGIELRVKGDGQRYKLILNTSSKMNTVGYVASFDTVKDQWQTVKLPFSSLTATFRGRIVPDEPKCDPSQIVLLLIALNKLEFVGMLNPNFVEGPFELRLSTIRAYINEPITPRFVPVSSAGVTRPDRPGLDLSKQPPAVRLNKELGYILTYKLKGEDVIRESGIPYTIVRPCALTEEPAGADLIFDQGDNITGKIAREEIARICIAALDSPYACDKTFEVKSTVPFSEPFVVDPTNPPSEKDYDVYFRNMKEGITG